MCRSRLPSIQSDWLEHYRLPSAACPSPATALASLRLTEQVLQLAFGGDAPALHYHDLVGAAVRHDESGRPGELEQPPFGLDVESAAGRSGRGRLWFSLRNRPTSDQSCADRVDQIGPEYCATMIEGIGAEARPSLS